MKIWEGLFRHISRLYFLVWDWHIWDPLTLITNTTELTQVHHLLCSSNKFIIAREQFQTLSGSSHYIIFYIVPKCVWFTQVGKARGKERYQLISRKRSEQAWRMGEWAEQWGSRSGGHGQSGKVSYKAKSPGQHHAGRLTSCPFPLPGCIWYPAKPSQPPCVVQEWDTRMPAIIWKGIFTIPAEYLSKYYCRRSLPLVPRPGVDGGGRKHMQCHHPW